MKLRFQYLLLFGWIVGPTCQVAAQTPEEYCKDHPDESKCVIFRGGQSDFYSKSGNVGGLGSRDTPANSRYVVFLHDAGASKELTDKLIAAIREKGYVVRGVDHDADKSGAGVDYFSEQDRSAASNVADIVNEFNASTPGGGKRLEPRMQRVKNPPGVLGLWLGATGK
jgi:hypothetical protein